MRLKSSILIKLQNDETIQYKAAVIILMHMAKRQNNNGYVKDLHYSEVCGETGYVRQTFYDTLKALRTGGYIKYHHLQKNGFYDIQILNNTISKGDQFLKLNDKELLSRELRNLSTAELKLYLYGRQSCYTTEKRKKAYTSITVMRLAQIIGISEKSVYLIKSMLEKVKSKTKMAINIEGNSDKPNWPSEILYLAYASNSEKEFDYDDCGMYSHSIKSNCRRAGIDSGVDQKAIMDTANLIIQYHKKADPNAMLKFIIDTILKRRSNEPKYIHQVLRDRFSF